MAEQPYCEHFDCACPPFVVDGTVPYVQWHDYVGEMGITDVEEATMKVLHLAKQDIPEGYEPVEEVLSRVRVMTIPTRPLIALGGLPARLDNHLNTAGDSEEDRADSWAAAAVPTMRALSEELYERYQQLKDVIGNVDGVLLAAATISDLADAIVVDYGIEETLTANQR